MKKIFFVLLVLFVSGCARAPYKSLNLDTTSNFRTPTQGKAGIYVFQDIRGIIGAAMDVSFEIKGLPEVFLNTGEFCYFEVDAGNYEYEVHGGLNKIYLPVEFEANQNYFFMASFDFLSDNAALVRDQFRIDYAKDYILTERFELCTKD